MFSLKWNYFSVWMSSNGQNKANGLCVMNAITQKSFFGWRNICKNWAIIRFVHLCTANFRRKIHNLRGNSRINSNNNNIIEYSLQHWLYKLAIIVVTPSIDISVSEIKHTHTLWIYTQYTGKKQTSIIWTAHSAHFRSM